MIAESLSAEEKEHRGAKRQEARNDAVFENAETGQSGEQEEQDEEPGGNGFGYVHCKFSFW